MNQLSIRNRQRVRAFDRPLLRRVARHLLEHLLGVRQFELAVHLVDGSEMARINGKFLGHAGPTDVITFDHLETPDPGRIYGEIFICVEQALTQARQFRTTWPSETVRYLVHGMLHLQGFDDVTPGDRRSMKREENRLLRQLSRAFPLRNLQQQAKVP